MKMEEEAGDDGVLMVGDDRYGVQVWKQSEGPFSIPAIAQGSEYLLMSQYLPVAEG